MLLIPNSLVSSNRVERHWNVETFRRLHVPPTFQRTETAKVIENKRVKYQRFKVSLVSGQALTMGVLSHIPIRGDE